MARALLCVLLIAILTVGLQGLPNWERGWGKGKGKGKGFGWNTWNSEENNGGKSQHGHSSEKADSDLIFEDGENAEITCPSGSFINITYARYGTKWDICDPEAFQIVSELCNGNETCNFMVDNNLFNDLGCMGSSSAAENLKLKIDFECKDPCKGFCCANGGECRVNSTTLTPMCHCNGSWTGLHCDDNPCNELTCENNGSCRVNPEDGSASCFCSEGFTGDNCSVVDCPLDCLNGGNCVNLPNENPQCVCQPGFQGPTCEIQCNAVQTCPVGFQELPPGSGNCFFICDSDSESWLAAEATCLAMGSTLWEPVDAVGTEAAAVFNALSNSEMYWTGGFDELQEGSPIFASSGLPVSWSAGVESSNSASKDCIEVLRQGGAWVFEYRTCSVSTRRCICKKLGPCETPQISLPGIPLFGK